MPANSVTSTWKSVSWKTSTKGRFRAICKTALEGLASKKLNLEMLIERRARAQERRLVPQTITRFLREAAEYVPMKLKFMENLPIPLSPPESPRCCSAMNAPQIGNCPPWHYGIPAVPPTGIWPKKITWNGSPPDIPCSRLSAATRMPGPPKPLAREPAFIPCNMRPRPASTSPAPGGGRPGRYSPRAPFCR